MGGFRAFGFLVLGFLAIALPSAASADELTAETYPASITGKSPTEASFKLTTTVGTLSCGVATYSGQMSGGATAVSTTLSLSSCIFPPFGGFPTTIDLRGCQFLFQIEKGTSTSGDLDLVCPEGGITITVVSAGTAKCTIYIPAQADLEGAVSYAGSGAGTTREIVVDANVTGLDYSHTKGTGLGACTQGSANTGSLQAKASFTGVTAGGTTHIGLFMSSV